MLGCEAGSITIVGSRMSYKATPGRLGASSAR